VLALVIAAAVGAGAFFWRQSGDDYGS
jgi:hypothetical protein